jgi:uncharacterized protein YbjT (DUF2867 family)
MTTRRLFIAGSTGAVGRLVVSLARHGGLAVVPHVRPKSLRKPWADPEAAVFELSEAEPLSRALQQCTTVLQLIGTTRKRFSSGDTYQTSDVATTEELLASARDAGVDHFILLSSVGADRPIGDYLKAKARAEKLVRESSVPFTIFRPSAFVGEGHKAPPGMKLITQALGLDRFKPVPVEDLARALVHVAATRSQIGQTLEGTKLWEVIDAVEDFAS